MFLLITRSRFPFYPFHIKAFPESICSFVQLLNKYSVPTMLPGLGYVCWRGESFLSSKDLGYKFCLGKTYKSKLPSNIIWSHKYLLKAHYVLSTGNIRINKMPWNFHFKRGTDRCEQAVLPPCAKTWNRAMCRLWKECGGT